MQHILLRKGVMQMEMNLHYKLSDGTLVPKRELDKAIDLVASLKGGFTLVELSDEELFAKGNKLEAIRRFMAK